MRVLSFGLEVMQEVESAGERDAIATPPVTINSLSNSSSLD